MKSYYYYMIQGLCYSQKKFRNSQTKKGREPLTQIICFQSKGPEPFWMFVDLSYFLETMCFTDGFAGF